MLSLIMQTRSASANIVPTTSHQSKKIGSGDEQAILLALYSTPTLYLGTPVCRSLTRRLGSFDIVNSLSKTLRKPRPIIWNSKDR